MDLPEWLTEYCTRVREALHLQAWQITYAMDDMPLEDRPACHASCTIRYPYWLATIRFRPSEFLEPSTTGKRGVIHEHLHISLADIEQAVEQGANSFMPKARHRRTFFDHIYNDAEERCITRLERAIYEMLEPPAPADRKKAP